MSRTLFSKFTRRPPLHLALFLVFVAVACIVFAQGFLRINEDFVPDWQHHATTTSGGAASPTAGDRNDSTPGWRWSSVFGFGRRPSTISGGSEQTLMEEDDIPAFCDRCSDGDKICEKYGEANLARAMSYLGSTYRLQTLFRRMHNASTTYLASTKSQKTGSKPPPKPVFKLGVLGGSVTHGHGVEEAHVWPSVLRDSLVALFPGVSVELSNGAVPAMESDYFRTCWRQHMDNDVDLVVIELGINDRRLEELAISYEFLMRELLELPSKPPVVSLQVLALSFEAITRGGDLHTSVAIYYDSPVISVRNLLLPHIMIHGNNTSLASGQPMQINKPSPPLDDKKATGNAYSTTSLETYWFTTYTDDDGGNEAVDFRHMNANGHLMMSELITWAFQGVQCGIVEGERRKKEKVFSEQDSWHPKDNTIPGPEVLEVIPRILLFGKYDHTTVTAPTRASCRVVGSKRNPLRPILVLPPKGQSITDHLSSQKTWRLWSPKQREDKVYLRSIDPGARIAFEVEVFEQKTERKLSANEEPSEEAKKQAEEEKKQEEEEKKKQPQWPGYTEEEEYTGPNGEIHLTFLRSKTFGLGSAWCWTRLRTSTEIDNQKKGVRSSNDIEVQFENEWKLGVGLRQKGVRLDAWWDHEENVPTSSPIADKLAPGLYVLYCELMDESKDPKGGKEFRIVGIDSI